MTVNRGALFKDERKKYYFELAAKKNGEYHEGFWEECIARMKQFAEKYQIVDPWKGGNEHFWYRIYRKWIASGKNVNPMCMEGRKMALARITKRMDQKDCIFLDKYGDYLYDLHHVTTNIDACGRRKKCTKPKLPRSKPKPEPEPEPEPKPEPEPAKKKINPQNIMIPDDESRYGNPKDVPYLNSYALGIVCLLWVLMFYFTTQ